jgi:hypothetical protein
MSQINFYLKKVINYILLFNYHSFSHNKPNTYDINKLIFFISKKH